LEFSSSFAHKLVLAAIYQNQPILLLREFCWSATAVGFIPALTTAKLPIFGLFCLGYGHVQVQVLLCTEL